MEEDRANQIQIQYIERELKDLRDQFNKFIGSYEEKMLALTRLIGEKEIAYNQVFMRRDVLDEKFQGVQTMLENILEKLTSNGKETAEVKEYLPMLKAIADERKNIKNKVIDIAGKVLFYFVLVILGIAGIRKI